MYDKSGIEEGVTAVTANGGTISFTVTVTYINVEGGQQQPAAGALTNALTMSLKFVQA